jgi:DNA-nicking Smr family endonuclease
VKRKKPEPETKPARVPEKLARPFAGPLAEMKKNIAAAKENAAKEAAREAAKPPAKKPPPAKQPPAKQPPRVEAPARPIDPLSGHAYEDRAAFHQAFAGVRPLHEKSRSPAPPKLDENERSLRAKVAADLAAADETARARLDALVAGNVGFVVRRNSSSGEIEGLRDGERDGVLRAITGPKVTPQGSIDLHGLTGPEAERELAKFVRARHARGDRTVLVVHGKGLHSDGGHGVLEDHALHCLTEGGGAIWVRAFVTAPERFGGRGALIVRLMDS